MGSHVICKMAVFEKRHNFSGRRGEGASPVTLKSVKYQGVFAIFSMIGFLTFPLGYPGISLKINLFEPKNNYQDPLDLCQLFIM